MLNNKQIIIAVLLLTIAFRAVIAPIPFDDNYSFHTDYSAHLHRIQVIKDYGFVDWDKYWYGGMPFLRFYPPLGHYLGSLLPFGDIDSYKLLLFLSFILTPIAVFLLLKEFNLRTGELAIGTLIISMLPRFAEILFYQNYGTTLALPLGLIFLKFFIRAQRNRSIQDIGIASIFLGATALTHTAVLAGMVILAIAYFIAKKFDKKNYDVKTMFVIFGLGLILSSFYYIPMLMEINYSSYGGNDAFGSTTNILLKPLVFLVKIFSHFTNYISILLGALIGMVLIYALLINIKTRRLFKFKFEIVAIVLFFLIYLTNIISFLDIERIATFLIFPISILLIKNLDNKYIKVILSIIILLEIAYFVNVMTPSDLNIIEESQVISLMKDYDGRAIFVPPLLHYNAFNYILPKYGIEVGGGSYFQGIYNIKETNRLGFIDKLALYDCYKKISLDELFKEMGLFSKSSTTKSSNCVLQNNNYKQTFQLQNVKRIIAYKDSPAVRLFQNDPDFINIGETENFSAFYFNSSSDYIETNVNYTYARSLAKIEIELQSNQMVQNVNVRVSETWYPHWKSNSIVLSPDSNGFITFTLSDLEGTKRIVLYFEPPQWYDYLYILSALTFISIVIYMVKMRKEV